jgi:type II secretory pathway predicted ATPase ExeA
VSIVIEAFFNFKHTPFERGLPTDSLYSTPALCELTSRLEYAATRRKFSVITGDTGVGKTTAVRKFVASLNRANCRSVYIADSALKPRVFYWEVLNQIANDEKPSFYRNEGKRKMMAHMTRLLEEEHVIPVVIIDEAHLLSYEMIEETRFLLNHNMDSQNPMSLVIVGQSELRAKLSKEIYEPVTQRIDFRFKLTPFDRAQTAEYIGAHLRYAGATGDIFSESAIDAVYEYSGGCARKINKVCSLGLLYAAQKGIGIADGASIAFVIDQELSW